MRMGRTSRNIALLRSKFLQKLLMWNLVMHRMNTNMFGPLLGVFLHDWLVGTDHDAFWWWRIGITTQIGTYPCDHSAYTKTRWCDIAKAQEIADALRALGISVQIDKDENKRPRFKFAEYEMKGIPVRIGIGLGIYKIMSWKSLERILRKRWVYL